ncbi:hypothetical protein PVAND_017721 [Polypedilum vanderplanki]|uniref:Uncharacterized protein n=1 Tax=Polypedilum vanderplanki TaxID=319348 RepID=A0A9J6B9E6_POLVA|nr:hypothetical protein PVAND_017721 [Polypedilum vanderplanki]
MFLPPIYDKNPIIEELEALYLSYIAIFGEQPRKVGLTPKDRLSMRYGKFEQFHKLTSNSILCHTTNWNIAEFIEDKMKDVLKKFGHCANFKGDNITGPLKKNAVYVVYLTKLKSDDCKCVICPKIWIEEEEEQKQHMLIKHPQLVKDFKKTITELQERNEDNSELIAMCREIIKWSE